MATINKAYVGREMAKLELAYRRFFPNELLVYLHKKSIADIRLGDQVDKKITILFSDIRNFTSISEQTSPNENFAFINSYLRIMEPIILKHNGIIDKYIGDAIMAIFPDSADSALDASLAMLKALKHYNKTLVTKGSNPISIGIGLNTGMAMLGIVGGSTRMEGTVISDAVNFSSRLENLTKGYGTPLLISEYTLYSLKNFDSRGIRFIDRVRVKGKSRPESVYEVFDHEPKPNRCIKNKNRKIFERALAYYHFKEIDMSIELINKCLKDNPDDIPAKKYLDRCQEYKKNGIHYGTGEFDQELEWLEEYNINISVIDQQHRQLFKTVKNLTKEIDEGKSYKTINNTLSFLEQYIKNHFTEEERLMVQYQYPFLLEHKNQHNSFIQNYLNLKKELKKDRNDKLYLLYKIKLFLMDWLIHHTTSIDRHMGRYITQKIIY